MVDNPHKLIPDKLKGRNSLVGNIPGIGDRLGHVSFMDVVVTVIGPVVLTLFLLGVVPPFIQEYSIPILVAVALVGFTFLMIIPPYTSITSLFQMWRDFHKTPNDIRAVTDGGDPDIDLRTWELDKSTVDFTGVEKIHSNRGVVEREDGVIVGGIRVEGTNLDSSTERETIQKTESWTAFLNNSLDFPIQIYLTTRRFNPKPFIKKYEERLEDPEVQSNPILSMYIQDYSRRAPEFLSSQFYREYYIIVPVKKSEVLKDSGGSKGLFNFEAIPGIGELLAIFLGRESGLTDEQVRNRQIDEVEKRIDKIRHAGLENIGSSGEQINANEFAALLKEFWEGKDMSHRMDEEFVRSSPIVVGDADKKQFDQVQQDSDSE